MRPLLAAGAAGAAAATGLVLLGPSAKAFWQLPAQARFNARTAVLSAPAGVTVLRAPDGDPRHVRLSWTDAPGVQAPDGHRVLSQDLGPDGRPSGGWEPVAAERLRCGPSSCEIDDPSPNGSSFRLVATAGAEWTSAPSAWRVSWTTVAGDPPPSGVLSCPDGAAALSFPVPPGGATAPGASLRLVGPATAPHVSWNGTAWAAADPAAPGVHGWQVPPPPAPDGSALLVCAAEPDTPDRPTVLVLEG